MSTIDLPVGPLVEDLSWCLDLAKAPQVRAMAEWAEQEVVLPNGPFATHRYRHFRHPVSKLFFDEIDSGRWSRIAALGPTQNGKTLMCYVIPTLYHLFELKETVIVGLPTMEMANDKWSEDFLPVIEASRFRELLPLRGEGSRGGQVRRSIHFRNGATLRFMSAGGSDKKRAAYTSRVVSVTETDGMDEAGTASREADKIEQIEARTRAFGRTGKRVYLECTVSIEAGRIWQEYQNGSRAVVLRPCPHCGEYVAPERENLKGWQDAETSEDAAVASYFECPGCEKPWTEAERSDAARDAVICHHGQKVNRRGKISGPFPKTQTFGFRWSAIDNPFMTAGDIGAEEWAAHRARNQENAEKKMRQFVWALPYDPPEVELTPLDPNAIEQRTTGLKKGIVPPEATDITIGIDTGKRMLHWTALAAGEGFGGRVIEYGKQPVDSDRLGVKQGLVEALGKLADYFDGGWTKPNGEVLGPSQVWIDSGWHEHTDAIYQFCAAANQNLELAAGSEMYRPTKGYGEGQRRMTRYVAPKTKQKGVVYLGNEFHIAKVRRNGRTVPGVLLVHVNADHWKSELHQRLLMPAEEALSVTLYEAASFSEHSEFARHLTAEKQVEKYVEGRGELVVWERTDRNNHWLDSTYAAVCAGEAVSEFRVRTKKKQTPRTLRQMAGVQ